MRKKRKLIVRIFFALVLAGSAAFLGLSATAGAAGDSSVDQRTIAGDYSGTTVITAHGDTEKSKLLVYGPDGGVQYVNSTYDRYFDVDPEPGTKNTVTYTAAMHVYGAPCQAGEKCSYSVIEQLNLTTGETNVLYKQYRPNIHNSRWHDADRIDEDRWVVADIAFDRVFIVNTTTGIVDWSWNAQNHFDMKTGNPYPEDWTHINDVEVTEGGQIMISVRNQDRIVFLDQKTGVVEDRTLGEEDNYSVLYEQHNPDYIDAERGGPAVLVADSHNNRIVEFQRSNGRWMQTWEWTDAEMQWPRDADRLPDGNTLISDSSGNRVLELGPDGDVLWSVTVDTPYEAEKLGTGDESAGGQTAQALGLPSKTTDGTAAESQSSGRPLTLQFLLFVRNLLPALAVNAVLYVLPTWVHFAELAVIGGLGLVVLSWAYLEYRWSRFSLRFGRPVRLDRGD